MLFPALRSPFLLSPKTTYYTSPRISLILRTSAILFLISISYYALQQSADPSTKVYDIIDGVISSISTTTDTDTLNTKAKTVWIEKSLQSEIDGIFDGTAIKAMCSKKRWDHRAVVSCGRIQGGVGNVRNVILTCLRFTMEAGADFVIPSIRSRSTSDLSVLDTDISLGFDYLFDQKHFKKTMKRFCPGMKVYESHEEVRTEQDGVAVGPLELIPDRKDRVLGNSEVAAWEGYWEKWLRNQEATNADKLSSGPIPVEFPSPLFHWPTDYDDADFVKSFGRVIQFREDTRRLAATVLWELSRKFELDLEPNEFMDGGMFFGAHLRTASDAAKAKWTGYEDQAANYLELAAKEHLSTIYVATGSMEDMARFSAQAWEEYQFNTTTKLDLLRGEDLDLLQSLSWDQQGLVDFLVMLKSSSFAGISESSFAWNIALKRHILSSDSTYMDHGQTLQDE